MNNNELKQTYSGSKLQTRFMVDNPKHKPFKKYHSDAGFNLFATENVIVPANSFAIISTGIKVAIPEGYVGILKSRGGMACLHGVETGAGVIDSQFRDYITVKLYNNSDKDYTVSIDDKLTQMLIMPVVLAEWIEVESLDETERGNDKFGSTGK